MDTKITVRIDSSRPIFVEADAEAFGQIFAGLNDDEQVNVLRSMVEHMRPHRMQWDYIAIALEKDENRDVRDDLSVIFPSTHELLAEIAKLQDAVGSWNPIASCPIREPVDLWCVYGGEEFAQFDGGASIGKLVSNRIKTDEYGFFGNQSNAGVPQRDAPDLVPVAWRKAVPNCPAEIIAEALGIPLTLEDALKEQADA
ncbi:MAG: hypothetical protein LCH99_30740 [Proteobacteria bacterium]|nr:hypothetical protein [Pseudomonadota bacterium]